MRKAYNVYTISEKTSIRAAFRKFTLLFAFGVCFLGFQAQGTAQAYSYTSTAPAGGVDQTGTFVDFPFIATASVAVSNEEAISILKTQRVLEGDGSNAVTDFDEINWATRTRLLDGMLKGLVSGADVQTSVYTSYSGLLNSPWSSNNAHPNIDPQTITEEYLRLLD